MDAETQEKLLELKKQILIYAEKEEWGVVRKLRAQQRMLAYRIKYGG